MSESTKIYTQETIDTSMIADTQTEKDKVNNMTSDTQNKKDKVNNMIADTQNYSSVTSDNQLITTEINQTEPFYNKNNRFYSQKAINHRRELITTQAKLNQLYEYLELLGLEKSAFCLQTISPTFNDSKLQGIYGKYGYSKADLDIVFKKPKNLYIKDNHYTYQYPDDVSLTELNSSGALEINREIIDFSAKGYNLYVTPNHGGRKEKEIKYATCLFFEFDDISLEQQRTAADKFGIPVGFKVFSGNKSYHQYIPLNKPLYDIERWKDIMYRLVRMLGSDYSVVDPCRVLRVPGVFNYSLEGYKQTHLLDVTNDKFDIDELDAAIISREKAYELEQDRKNTNIFSTGHISTKTSQADLNTTNNDEADVKTALLKAASELTQIFDNQPKADQPAKESKADVTHILTNAQKQGKPPFNLVTALPKDVQAYVNPDHADYTDGVIADGERNHKLCHIANALKATANFLTNMNADFTPSDPKEIFDAVSDRSDANDKADIRWFNRENPQPTNPDYITHKVLEHYDLMHLLKSSQKSKSAGKVKGNVILEALEFFFSGHWICVENDLYEYNGNHYKLVHDEVLIEKISNYLCNYQEVKYVKSEAIITYPYADPKYTQKVLTQAKDRVRKTVDVTNPEGLNCTNGILRVQIVNDEPVFKLHPHNPSEFYLYPGVVTYDENADTTECDKLLACLEPGQREIFLRVISAALDIEPVRAKHGRVLKALLLIGEGSNGKDALRVAVENIWSDKGITSKGLKEFEIYDSGRKFDLNGLSHSRINWCSENTKTTKIDNIQSLKAFITGQKLIEERKGVNGQEYTPKAIGLFNLNSLPSFEGTHQHALDRFAPLTFSYIYTADPKAPNERKADPRFVYDQKFLREQVAPAFLNYLVDAYKKMWKEGIDYTPTLSAYKHIQRENDHLWDFIEDTGLSFTGNEADYLTAKQIYEALEKWYRSQGIIDDTGHWQELSKPSDKPIKAVNQIKKRFLSLFPKAKEGKQYIQSSNNTFTVIKGLKFDPTKTFIYQEKVKELKEQQAKQQADLTNQETTKTVEVNQPTNTTQPADITTTTATTTTTEQTKTDKAIANNEQPKADVKAKSTAKKAKTTKSETAVKPETTDTTTEPTNSQSANTENAKVQTVNNESKADVKGQTSTATLVKESALDNPNPTHHSFDVSKKLTTEQIESMKIGDTVLVDGEEVKISDQELLDYFLKIQAKKQQA
jgi:phage/plasmid-associated DNA primase